MPRPLLVATLTTALLFACATPRDTPAPGPASPQASLLGEMPALFRAVLDGDAERITALRQAGADESATFAGWTPFDMALAIGESLDGNSTLLAELDATQLACLEASSIEAAQLDAVIDALLAPLPVDPAARRVVEAWFRAAAAGDEAAAMALGTPAWCEEQRNWAPSFSRAVFSNGVVFESYELTGAETLGELTVVSVRARLLRPDGSTDGEGMTFKLQPFAEGLKIVDLR